MISDPANVCMAAASTALDALFGGELPIYGEEVPAKLPARCIILGLEDVDLHKELGRRYLFKATLDIAYYMPVGALDRDRELNQVYARCCALHMIDHGGLKLSLPNMQRNEQNGVLHIKCPISTYLYRVSDDPAIGKIMIKAEV